VKTIPNHITSCSKFQKCEIEPWHIINTPKTKQNDFYERLINRSPYWQKIEKKEDPLVFINSIHINQLDSNHKLYEISINYFIENDLISYNKKIYNDKIFWDYNFKGSHGELRLSEFKKLLKKYEIKEIKEVKKDMNNIEQLNIIKKEIRKEKELIEKIKNKRKEKIKESNFRNLLDEKWHDFLNKRKWKFDTHHITFLDFLEDNNINKNIIKTIRKFKYKKKEGYNDASRYLYELVDNYSNEEWKKFEKLLEIIEEYYPKFQLYEAKKELCYYTDCYKKLATEKFCNKCSSNNPLEAIFCNMCGNKL